MEDHIKYSLFLVDVSSLTKQSSSVILKHPLPSILVSSIYLQEVLKAHGSPWWTKWVWLCIENALTRSTHWLIDCSLFDHTTVTPYLLIQQKLNSEFPTFILFNEKRWYFMPSYTLLFLKSDKKKLRPLHILRPFTINYFFGLLRVITK